MPSHLDNSQLRYIAKLAVLYDIKDPVEREKACAELDTIWKSMNRWRQEAVERYLSQNDPPPHRRGVL